MANIETLLKADGSSVTERPSDNSQATKPLNKAKRSLWGRVKQFYGKVNRTYGMILNHPAEIRAVLENYCYVEHDIGHSDFSMNEDGSVNRITRYDFDAKFVARVFEQHKGAIRKVNNQQKVIFLDSYVRASPPITIYNSGLWDHTYYDYFVHNSLIRDIGKSEGEQILFDDKLKEMLEEHQYGP